METLLTLHAIMLVGMMFHTLAASTNRSNYTPNHLKNRPGKRNTKFLFPALISHMYHQRMDVDSPLSTVLNRSLAKRINKQGNEKRDGRDDSLEHKTIVGNPKRDEHVRNVPKTKQPGAKTKEITALIEVQSQLSGDGKQQREQQETHEKNEKYSDKPGDSVANIKPRGSVVQVSKHFSPLSRNWYAGPPSIIWPPPAQYSHSYAMPFDHYTNQHFSRPLYSGSPAFHQEGFLQHLIGPPRNKFIVSSHEKDSEEPNQNVVAQEKKFVVTNVTKYVLDFYCPHCGGEISVSKNRNKGNLFGADPGAISINKGMGESNQSKKGTTASPKESITEQ